MTPVLLCIGLVVGISDGDSLRVRCPEVQADPIRVRLAEVDAPEKGQPYGNNAREALADLVFEKTVEVHQVDTDRYGRVVARLSTHDHADVNFEMVSRGMSWCYPKYVRREEECRRAEWEAKASRLGLWADQRPPMAPWEWRKVAKGAGR